MQLCEALPNYTYDLATTPAGTRAGGCLTAKKGAQGRVVFAQWGAVFVDFFHILLLFVTFFTAHNFYKLFFTAETGVRFVTFFYFFLLFVTFINYFLLLRRARVYILFIVRGGKGCTLILHRKQNLTLLEFAARKSSSSLTDETGCQPTAPSQTFLKTSRQVSFAVILFASMIICILTEPQLYMSVDALIPSLYL